MAASRSRVTTHQRDERPGRLRRVFPHSKRQTTEGICGAPRNESQSFFRPTRLDPRSRTNAKWNALTRGPNSGHWREVLDGSKMVGGGGGDRNIGAVEAA